MQRLLSGLAIMCLCAAATAQQAPNPDYVYLTQGQTPGPWQWVLSDPDNWWKPVPDKGGESAGGKISLSNAEDGQFPGAVKLKWSRSSDWGGAALTGGKVDLSGLEQAAELVLAVKVASRVPQSVKLKMSCGEGCETQVDIADNLKQGPGGQWFALPVALDCFSTNGVDLSQVDGPFSIGTTGKLELHLAEISIGAMAEGDTGCVPDE